MFTDKTFSTGADLEAVSGEFGLAIDLGTTTVAAFLAGLTDGKVYAGNASLNQQARYGAEVMSRLFFAEKEGGLSGPAWQSAVAAAAGLSLRGGAFAGEQGGGGGQLGHASPHAGPAGEDAPALSFHAA